jgi:NNP family nitrate/nitrite transporter-like MFS transporter
VAQINSTDDALAEKSLWRKNVRTWILPFGLFLFVIVIESMDANSFAPVMAQIKSAWDMTNTHVGIYSGMAGLIPILVAVPIGEAVRRWGAKHSVIGSMAVIFIGAMIMATAKGFAQGLAGRIFTAGGLRMGTVAAWAGATMVAPASFRTSAWAVMNTALAIGAITGSPLVGGYIGGNFGWQAVFFTISALSVFCILLIGFFLRMPPAGIADSESAIASTPASKFNIYKCWDIYLAGIIFNFMIGSSLVAIVSFAPLAMEERWQMDPQAIGNILGLSYSVGLPVMLAAGVLADKLRTRKKIMIATGIPMAVGLFMLTSQDQTIFTLGLIGYLGFAYAPGAMLYACAPEMVPKGTNLGPVYGLLSTISSAGAFVTPIVVGWMRDTTGDFNSGFILLGILCTLSLLLSFKLRAR